MTCFPILKKEVAQSIAGYLFFRYGDGMLHDLLQFDGIKSDQAFKLVR